MFARSFVAFVACSFVALCRAAEPSPLPSVDALLAAHAANEKLLETLHLQGTHTQEQAHELLEYIRQAVQIAKAKLAALPDDASNADELAELARQIDFGSKVKTAPPEVKPFEIFLRGDEYQLRAPNAEGFAQPGPWTWPRSAPNAKSLVRDYEKMSIYTRSDRQTPPGRVWTGSAEGQAYQGMHTSVHAGEFGGVMLPPSTRRMGPSENWIHPFDDFYTPDSNHTVVRRETLEGVETVVVEARVVHRRPGDAEGKAPPIETHLLYRGWLDLERGAIPLKLECWVGNATTDAATKMTEQPERVTTCREIRKLATGGYFAATTSKDSFMQGVPDSDLANKWIRYAMETWNCTLVETEVPDQADFFAFEFPAGQSFYTLETGKEVEGTPPLYRTQIGDEVSDFEVARWLDGQPRTLAELRGRVVVVYFLRTPSPDSKVGVDALKNIQAKYADQPVTIIAMHTAEADTAKLTSQVTEYAAEQDWHAIQAIDAGFDVTTSQTMQSWGVHGTPITVVLDRAGKVIHSDEIPPAGLEDLVGMSGDNMTPEINERIFAEVQRQMLEAGIEPPVSFEALGDEEGMKLMGRLHEFKLGKVIDAALAE